MGYNPQEARTVVPFRNFEEELRRPGVWETGQGATSTADTSRDNLATLYRPPFALMFHGPFEKVNFTFFFSKLSAVTTATCRCLSTK